MGGVEVWLMLTLIMPKDVPDKHYREKTTAEECFKMAQAWFDAGVSPEERELGAVGHGAACYKMNDFQEKM